MNPVIFWTIATVMVVIATLAVAAPIFWVRAATPQAQPRRSLLAMVALTAGVPLVSLAIYAKLGSPTLLGLAPTPAAAQGPPHVLADGAAPGGMEANAAAGANSTAGGDMNAAIARLEAKLAKSPNDAAGWQLLAQSYDFVGRSADAAAARARAGGAPPPGNSPASGASLLGAAAAMQGAAPASATSAASTAMAASSTQTPLDPLAESAEKARRERDFPRAVAAFKQLAARGDMSADLWADYADALAAANGRLDGASEPMIKRALVLDPQHVKALWLLGSLQDTRRDTRAALATWQKLAQLLPPESPDAKLIAANVAEARATLGLAPAPVTTVANAANAGAPAAGAASLSGQVQLDVRFKSRVPADTVLFIFAKSVDQPGPPLAVFRSTAAAWPVSFVLDDSMAMMPGRRLSDFSRVTVEARLSRTGSANPSPGDLRGATGPLDPRQGRAPLRIVINEEVR